MFSHKSAISLNFKSIYNNLQNSDRVKWPRKGHVHVLQMLSKTAFKTDANCICAPKNKQMPIAKRARRARLKTLSKARNRRAENIKGGRAGVSPSLCQYHMTDQWWQMEVLTFPKKQLIRQKQRLLSVIPLRQISYRNISTFMLRPKNT